MSDGEYLSIESAARVTGIPPRTLRRWVQDGKVTAIAGQRGKLVRVADIETIGHLTGRPVGHDQVADESAGHIADQVAASSPAINQQMSAIRDQWLQPLVDQIADLSKEVGRLEAENAALRAQIEQPKTEDPEIVKSPDPAIQETAKPSWWRRLFG